MYEITRLPSVIDIGYTGEMNYRVVEIDLTKWVEEIPDGIPHLIHIRPNDTTENAYIVTTTFSNNILRWVVTDSDLGTVEGMGLAQVWFELLEDNDVIVRAKSAQFSTRIHGAINDPSDTPPSSQAAWLEMLTELEDRTECIPDLSESAAQSDGFIKTNDLDCVLSDKVNVIKSPYETTDMEDSSYILSNGNVSQSSSYAAWCVSPMIEVSEGLYGLKTYVETYEIGKIGPGKNGFTFIASDGTSVVSRDGSEITEISTIATGKIYTLDIPSGVKYVRFSVYKSSTSNLSGATTDFNKWILLPNANDHITEDFFILASKKEDGTLTELKRADGSKMTLIDQYARGQIASIQQDMSDANFDGINAFFSRNSLKPDIINIIEVPYASSAYAQSSMILSNGSIGDGNTYRNYCVTPLIPVSQGKYALYVPLAMTEAIGALCSVNNGYGLYASDGTTAVTRVSFETITTGIYQITVPATAKYIRFTVFCGPNNSGEYSQNKFENAVDYVNKYWVMIKSDSTTLTSADFAKLPDGSINRFVRADGSMMVFSTNEVPKQKILVFGDSIWGNDRSNGVADFLKEYSGAMVYNCAIGGTWICDSRDQYSSPKFIPFDGIALVHAKMTDTWTDIDANLSEMSQYVQDETIPLLKEIDMSTIDMVILAYGTNDFTANRTKAEVKAAFATVITEILTDYPNIRFLVISPAWRMVGESDADTYTNTNGDTLRELGDAIREQAKAMHITSIDMMTECPWCALTKGYYLDNDEVHPNTEGNKVYAHIVNGKLQSMF